jgi:hypothetical protein
MAYDDETSLARVHSGNSTHEETNRRTRQRLVAGSTIGRRSAVPQVAVVGRLARGSSKLVMSGKLVISMSVAVGDRHAG